VPSQYPTSPAPPTTTHFCGEPGPVHWCLFLLILVLVWCRLLLLFPQLLPLHHTSLFLLRRSACWLGVLHLKARLYLLLPAGRALGLPGDADALRRRRPAPTGEGSWWILFCIPVCSWRGLRIAALVPAGGRAATDCLYRWCDYTALRLFSAVRFYGIPCSARRSGWQPPAV